MLKPSQRSRETDWTGAGPGRLGAALTLWHVQVSYGSDVYQGAPSPACERWPARRSRLGFSQLVGPRRHRGPVASSRPRLFPEAEAQRPGSGQRPPSPALFRAALQTRCSLPWASARAGRVGGRAVGAVSLWGPQGRTQNRTANASFPLVSCQKQTWIFFFLKIIYDTQ